MNAQLDSKAVTELAADYMRIFKAGHDAGYRTGYAEAIAACQKIIKNTTFGEKLPDDVQ